MKTTKKLAAFLLAAALVASTAACGGGGTSPSGSAPESKSAATSAGPSSAAEVSTTAEEDGPLTPYAEPVTITCGLQAKSVQQFFDGDTWDNNRWTRKIKDELNIDVKVAFTADVSTDAYRNKINALLASGDLPDVYRWADRTFFRQAYEAGYVQDITDVFEKYASDAIQEYKTKYPESFEGASIDGRLYGFPAINDNFHQASNLWIRDDWLENTNSEAPKTVDEMIELARKFTFEDPDKNGKDDTYGFALAGDVVQSNYGTLLGLLAAYGVPGYGSTGIFYRGDDGKITTGYIQPGAKEALAKVRQMYEEGLIDPEFVVKDVANMETDIGSGKIGMMYHMNWGTWHPFNLIYQNEGVITRPYPIPTVDGIEPKMGINSNKTGDLFMVNSKCEHPDAMIKIVNLYNKVCYESTDPEDFATYWENEQSNFVPMYVIVPNELYATDIQAAFAAGSDEGLSTAEKPFYHYVLDFESGKNTDTNAYGTWGQMSENGSMAIDLEAQAKGQLVTNLMAGEIPATWQQNSSVLGDMVLTAYTDIILGNKPLDYFDQFVQEWLQAGGQQTLDEMEELYPQE